MSLHSLARYDDAEDEIRDEDHNLVLKQKSPTPQPEVIDSPVTKKPTPTPDSVDKPKILVDYGGGSSDEETNSSDNEEVDTKVKPAIVNLGLYDGSSVLTSTGTDSPKQNERSDSSPRDGGGREDRTVTIPPEPPGRCSKSLQEKLAKMIEKKRNGQMNVNEYVQQKKEFRNPSIYEKLVDYIGIDEHGTNFPKELYDPSIWGPESYYEALAKTQKEYNKEREKEKAKRTQVDFISGTKKSAQAPITTTAEKRSKWDQKAPPPPKLVSAVSSVSSKIPSSIQSAIKSNSKN